MDRKSSISLQLAIPERERSCSRHRRAPGIYPVYCCYCSWLVASFPWDNCSMSCGSVCVKFSQWLCCTICAFRTELPLSSSSSIIFFFFILFAQLRYSSPASLSFADSLQELFVVGICHGIGEAHQLGTGLQASQPQWRNSKGLIYTRRHAGYPQNDI